MSQPTRVASHRYYHSANAAIQAGGNPMRRYTYGPFLTRQKALLRLAAEKWKNDTSGELLIKILVLLASRL